MIKILDNSISKGFQQILLNSVKDIPWFFNETVTYEGEDENTGFYHMVYSVSENKPVMNEKLYEIILPCIHEIIDKFQFSDELEEVYRIKLGMFVKNQSKHLNTLHHGPHVDAFVPHYTLLYYMNDTDGPTYIFDDNKNIVNKVEPKIGRSVLMSGDTYHASSCPRNTSRRIVLNVNFGKRSLKQ